MLKFFLLFLVSFSAYGQGDLSGNLRSQFNNTRLNFGNLQVPNNQATKTGAINALIETGNKNILSNPGFEHTLASTGWTITGTATTSTETAAPLAGLKSFRADMTAQTFNLKQTTTIYAAARAGSQMFARIQIKNTAPDCTMYIVKNSVRQTGANDQLAISTDGVTRTYELAFLADGTSNGFEVDCTSTTGVIITDEGELSTESSAFVDVAQIGPWINAGVITFGATTTAPTKGVTTRDSLQYRINGSNLDINLEYSQAAGSDGSGTYLISMPSGFAIDTNITGASTTISNDTFASDRKVLGYGTLLQNGGRITTLTFYAYDSTRIYAKLNLLGDAGGTTLESQSGDAWSSVSSGIRFSGATGLRANLSIPVQGLSNKVSTYSQFAVSDVSVENVFSAKISSTGVVSDENLDWINGNCTASAGKTTCQFKPDTFTVAPNCWAITRTTSGGTISETIYMDTANYSATEVAFRQVEGGAASLDAANLFCTKQGADFKAKNVITGSFQGIEKCADPYECTDTFSAEVESNGTVVRENIDWINGNCTNPSTGINICTLTSSMALTSKLVCTATPALQTGALSTTVRYEIGSSTTTALEFISLNASFTPVNEKKMIICQKQGVDFRPKTAVAGTFLDSVTSPGAGKVSLCSAKISSTGVISDQIGGCFASCTNATTPVCTFTSNYWVSGSVPNCTWACSTEFQTGGSSSSTTFSGNCSNSSGVAQATARVYSCQGLKQ